MCQHKGFVNAMYPHCVCHLKEALYGFKQTSRASYTKLINCLLTWGFKSSQSDCSVMILDDGQHVVILLIYVDNIIVTCKDLNSI